MKRSRLFWTGVVTGLAVGVILLLLVFFGTSIFTLATGKSLSLGAMMDSSVQTKLEMLNSVIDKNYVVYDESIEQIDRVEGMYKGLVASLGDPYSDYYTVEELNQEQEDDSGMFGGIGVSIGYDRETRSSYVAGFAKNSPGKDAGLKEDDIFYAVDGQLCENLSQSEIVALCRGEAGTEVEIVVLRGDTGEKVTVKITRDVIENETVDYEKIEDGIGYIQITEFNQLTAKQFKEAKEQAQADKIKKLVLDLRSNYGGDVSAVLSVCDDIMADGVIVSTKNKNGEGDIYSATGESSMDCEIVVLTNGYTASAAEILTGALKDNKLATVMGTKTYGKGIMQTVFPLQDGSAIKLTTYMYYTPSGVNIQGSGINPDIELEFDADAYSKDKKNDNQKSAAVEYLKKH
ncbi:MAG: S41 family peptidase [Lachnospiraceae bacterium]|nr:S41 family peptidase [Lachnospiraceae bacterium]